MSPSFDSLCLYLFCFQELGPVVNGKISTNNNGTDITLSKEPPTCTAPTDAPLDAPKEAPVPAPRTPDSKRVHSLDTFRG